MGHCEHSKDSDTSAMQNCIPDQNRQDCNLIKSKSRVCIRCDLQFLWECNQTDSQTVSFASVCTLLALAAQEGYNLLHWDIQVAFITANINTDINMSPPAGYSLPPGKCFKLLKSLYRLNRALGCSTKSLNNGCSATVSSQWDKME